ncbi:MAG: hypothetical protein M3367_12725 [Acidobacteriota bacterium]|nr:hypothetical protein [Acidobacteriota bacterium]
MSKTDVAVFRGGVWYLLRSAARFLRGAIRNDKQQTDSCGFHAVNLSKKINLNQTLEFFRFGLHKM